MERKGGKPQRVQVPGDGFQGQGKNSGAERASVTPGPARPRLRRRGKAIRGDASTTPTCSRDSATLLAKPGRLNPGASATGG